MTRERHDIGLQIAEEFKTKKEEILFSMIHRRKGMKLRRGKFTLNLPGSDIY